MIGHRPVRNERLDVLAMVGDEAVVGHDLQGIFTLTLSAIRVHGSHRQTLVVEIVIDHVALKLGVGEDQDATGLLRENKVK
jgi:hypothetical protein